MNKWIPLPFGSGFAHVYFSTESWRGRPIDTARDEWANLIPGIACYSRPPGDIGHIGGGGQQVPEHVRSGLGVRPHACLWGSYSSGIEWA